MPTCHHPSLGTGDGLSLPLGEGARGLGAERVAGSAPEDAVHERVPRNSPPLFNLGAREFTRMFHDGRVEVDTAGHYASGFISPARWKLPEGLDNALAAQAMFPPTSPAEMAGHAGENDVARARRLNNVAGKAGVWELLATRLAGIPEYVELFRAAFPDEVREPADVSFVLAANAIAAFEATAFRADDSPFDRHLRGEESLPEDARRGMELFYGRAGCSSCHSGPFQTDHGLPRDRDAAGWPRQGGWLGRRLLASNRAPRLRRGLRAWPRHGSFRRQLPLPNSVAAQRRRHGAVGALRRLHHARGRGTPPPRPHGRPRELRAGRGPASPAWERCTRRPPPALASPMPPLPPKRLEGFHRRDTWVQSSDVLRGRIAAANELAPVPLLDGEVADLLRYLESLTDPRMLALSHLVPEQVPSGLPVED